jgi:hypothetical protein
MIKINAGDRIEASEYDLHHVCFEVEPKSCAQGQLVKIDGIINFVDSQVRFTGLGKVLKVQTQQNQKLKITIEFRSHDQEFWNSFVSVMQESQDRIDRIFSSMRDEE